MAQERALEWESLGSVGVVVFLGTASLLVVGCPLATPVPPPLVKRE